MDFPLSAFRGSAWVLICVLPLGFAVALCLTSAIYRYALAYGMVDIPNERSSHQAPTPRGAGLAIAIAYCLTMFLLLLSQHADLRSVLALSGGLAVAGVGYLDDRVTLSAMPRLAVQLASAVWILSWLDYFAPVPVFELAISSNWVLFPLAAIGVVGFINFYNFMDGIDGIAGVEALTVSFAAGCLIWWNGDLATAIQLFVLASVCVGFLVWNWPPAKIFMGDVGSGYLGFLFAGYALMSHTTGVLTIWSWLILLSVFLIDPLVTLGRRLAQGERVFEAHRSHAYQHAARRYGRHMPVIAAVAAINLLWLFPLAYWASVNPKWGLLLLVFAWMPLVFLVLRFRAGLPECIGVR